MSEQRVKCRVVREDDYPQVHRLKVDVGIGQGDTEERWRHVYYENPALRHFEGNWPRGWVLEAEGKIVGYTGNFPQVYMYRRREVVVAVGSGLSVLPGFRAHTIALALKQFEQSVDLIIGTTTSAESSPFWVALGSTVVPDTSTTFVFVRKYRPRVAAVLRRRKLPEWVVGLASPPLSFGLSIKAMFTGRSFPRGGHPQRLERFDERFDQFWSRVIESNDKLLAVRDRRTLAWHFHELLRTRGGTILVREDTDGALLGYAVLISHRRTDSPAKWYLLADLQVLGDDRSLADLLVRDAFRVCVEDDVSGLRTRGFSGPIRGVLEEHRPITKQASIVATMKVNDKSLRELLTNPEQWFFSPYDGDTIL